MVFWKAINFYLGPIHQSVSRFRLALNVCGVETSNARGFFYRRKDKFGKYDITAFGGLVSLERCFDIEFDCRKKKGILGERRKEH